MSQINRILVADRREEKHALFREVFQPGNFDETSSVAFELVLIDKEVGILEAIGSAEGNGYPFALLFLEAGLWRIAGGFQLLKDIRLKHPKMEIVLMTDEPVAKWDDTYRDFGHSERVMLVRDDLSSSMLEQLAFTLASRWRSNKAGAKARDQFKALLGQSGDSEVPMYDDDVVFNNTRILICDDTESIHEDFIKILSPSANKNFSKLDEFESSLFDDEEEDGEPKVVVEELSYEIDSAFQGHHALEMVEKAENEGRPYPLIFMDVRMPPGWDGVETIRRIWDRFPFIEMVIVTAYSDYSWEEMVQKVGSTDRLIFLKKPFDRITVKQMALTLTNKWKLGCMARKYVAEVELLEKETSRRTEQLKNLLNGMKGM